MTNFIETKWNDFVEAHQNQIINKLIDYINNNLEIKKDQLIEEENIRLAEKHAQWFNSLTPEDQKQFKDSKPETVSFKSPTEEFSFLFNQLLKENKTILHDVDAAWQLIIKLYEFKEQVSYKFKSTYKVELN